MLTAVPSSQEWGYVPSLAVGIIYGHLTLVELSQSVPRNQLNFPVPPWYFLKETPKILWHTPLFHCLTHELCSKTCHRSTCQKTTAMILPYLLMPPSPVYLSVTGHAKGNQTHTYFSRHGSTTLMQVRWRQALILSLYQGLQDSPADIQIMTVRSTATMSSLRRSTDLGHQ